MKHGLILRTITPTAVLTALLTTESAFGHAFGQRFDLPIPLNYYLVGAGGAVFFSFVLVVIFARVPLRNSSNVPQINIAKWRPVQWVARPVCIQFIRMLALFLFLVTLVAGFIGPQDAAKNILPTVVWIIWWTGMAYFCALMGDLWHLINPWSSSFSLIENLYRRIRGTDCGPSLDLNYPSWLGYWPACIVFVVFVWGELVWPSNAIPLNLAIAIAGYSVFTWTGMAIFGRETWLTKAEAFTLFFGLLARFSVFEAHKPYHQNLSGKSIPVRSEWNLRLPGAGLIQEGRVSRSLMAFIILMLSTVTFDGFMGTPLWAEFLRILPDWRPLQPILFRLEMWGVYRDIVLTTAGLILFPLLFGGLYMSVAWAMRFVSSSRAESDRLRLMRTSDIASYFVITLLPIAIAYHLAHYFSYLLIVGQFIIPLASDPFGLQWNLFGTIDYKVNIAIVDARFAWNTSLVAIVAGHIIAVYVAHILALRLFDSRKQALISQIPMLVLMVLYTVLSLWILAQPLIE
ncbi:MAG: hypothetical protein HOC23_03030 [Halieaceae bacterium]|jgi:hypothetical protein|nr:hypothetical protein [Halieaceae bacterium]